MDSKIDPVELQTTKDLLKDFAAKPHLTAEDVYKKSWSRYSILEQVPLYEIFNDSWFLRIIRRSIYAKLPQAFHKFIYDDLFTFAGRYRNVTDPHGGNIYFGKQLAHRRKPKFTGYKPDMISKGVSESVIFLKKKPEDPLYAAARFYQKFVNVHPFYDGNGRIGRLIASIYLADHNLALSWSEFDSKTKFIKKLNRCHLYPSEETFEYLVNYLKPFTLSLDELDP